MLSAIGTFGQFVVVTVAAAFATVQIRQLRRQNELQATIPYFSYSHSTAYRSAVQLVRMQTSAPDDQLTAAIAAGDFSDPRFRELSFQADLNRIAHVRSRLPADLRADFDRGLQFTNGP